jgi:hypothetical protein
MVQAITRKYTIKPKIGILAVTVVRMWKTKIFPIEMVYESSRRPNDATDAPP